jgi:predicted ATP-dependent serine protease
MGENKLNITLLYIYPKIKEINKEINLFRIIDNNIKETIIIYCLKEKDSYKVFMINTMFGEAHEICNVADLVKLDTIISKFKKLEKQIICIDNLQEIEKYILKVVLN